MSHPVRVLGIGADGLSSLSTSARAELDAATFIAGGRRHLELIGPRAAETLVVRDNMATLVDRLARRRDDERCVVLASGDPLFYGIGHRLLEQLGHRSIVIEPVVSSMQLAFARAGLAWHEATIASIHGRPLAKTLLPLLGDHRIGLFTHDGTSPAAVATFFLEHGLEDYDAWVCERLGAVDEKVSACRLRELTRRVFDDLNVLILQRGPEVSPLVLDGPAAGLDDGYFAQPDAGPVLLTHADVRAIVLSRFRELPEGPIWDIGAGLGGVAIELARAFRTREVLAVERSPRQASFLALNRARFGTYNLRLVAGEAPEALDGEEPPAGVFLGGSAGRLTDILALVMRRLIPLGKLVANFVCLENLTETLAVLKHAGWPTQLSQIMISHDQVLGGLTSLVPQRPVWVLRSTRPFDANSASGPP